MYTFTACACRCGQYCTHPTLASCLFSPGRVSQLLLLQIPHYSYSKLLAKAARWLALVSVPMFPADPPEGRQHLSAPRVLLGAWHHRSTGEQACYASSAAPFTDLDSSALQQQQLDREVS
jgi:hypothetical protein